VRPAHCPLSFHGRVSAVLMMLVIASYTPHAFLLTSGRYFDYAAGGRLPLGVGRRRGDRQLREPHLPRRCRIPRYPQCKNDLQRGKPFCRLCCKYAVVSAFLSESFHPPAFPASSSADSRCRSRWRWVETSGCCAGWSAVHLGRRDGEKDAIHVL